MGTCGENWEDFLQWSPGNHLAVDYVQFLKITSYSDNAHISILWFYVHQRDIPSTIKSRLHCFVIAMCRGCAVAVAAFEDRIAIFPTSIAAGNNVVDKVLLLSYLSPCCEKRQNVFPLAAMFKSLN